MNASQSEQGKLSEILIVDDEDKNLQLLGSRLRKEGYRVIVASNGEEAIDSVMHGQPDLILLDVSMPGMNGYEVCRQLKSNPSHSAIPVIFITARTASEDVLEGFEAGAQDYISKPLKTSEMLARIKTHLDLKRARIELENLNAANEALIAQQKRTFSILSHDLRGSIAASSALLTEVNASMKKGESVADLLDLLGEADASMHQLSQLVQDVLEWSKVQMRTVQIRPRQVALGEMVDAHFHALKKMALEKHVALKHKVSEDCLLTADPDVLNTVLRNLISNSLKFTPEEGEISVGHVSKGDDIEISVTDTGIGISAGDIDKILAKKAVTSRLGTAKEKGSGLGLSLCIALIEQHNGKCSIESKAGKGTTFRFTLPNDGCFE